MKVNFMSSPRTDTVYMLWNPVSGFLYGAPAKTATQAWANGLKTWSDMYYTKETLYAEGWRARRVKLELV